MTKISIEGAALVQFIFDYIPSANEAIDKARSHWSTGHEFTKKWHAQGEDLARDFIRSLGEKQDLRQYVIKARAFVWVRVFRASEWPTYDIHNPYVKPLFDGFTDAGIWQDDDWPSVPQVLFSWQPYDERLKLKQGGPLINPDIYEPGRNLFVVEIHELESFTYNGVAQVLPSGRIKA